MIPLRLKVFSLFLLGFCVHCSHVPNRSSLAAATANVATETTDVATVQENDGGNAAVRVSAINNKADQGAEAPSQSLSEALKSIALDDTWELVSNEGGILVHKRQAPGSPIVEFRGEATIDAPVTKVLQVLGDSSRKVEWVDRLHSSYDIGESTPLRRIEYNRTKAPWPVKDRDFVFEVLTEVVTPEKMVVLRLRSIDLAELPEQDCCIRGILNHSTQILRSVENGRQTHITVEISADPKGAVPTWIVNLIQKSWPKKTITALKQQVAKADVSEHPYFKPIFDRLWRTGRPDLKAASQ